MDLGPHAGFILASYGAMTFIVAGLIAWFVLDGRRQVVHWPTVLCLAGGIISSAVGPTVGAQLPNPSAQCVGPMAGGVGECWLVRVTVGRG